MIFISKQFKHTHSRILEGFKILKCPRYIFTKTIIERGQKNRVQPSIKAALEDIDIVGENNRQDFLQFKKHGKNEMGHMELTTLERNNYTRGVLKESRAWEVGSSLLSCGTSW